MDSLRELILYLIETKREDNYWDFKQEWHNNNADLLHDIICLANAEHSGDRYLIIGITDPPECEIVGIEADVNRKDQAKLIDFLSKMPFSGDLRPNVSLKTVIFPQGSVDIIVVFDEKHKPFTLKEIKTITSKYPSGSDNNKSLYPGAIYTRVMDKNTASDRTADIYFVERMWRERFGLDLNPLDRIINYLIDYKSWIWDGIATGYYKLFPEFTLVCEQGEKLEESEHWWHRWPFDEPSRRMQYQFKYHNTILEMKKVVHFDRESFSIPFPEIEFIPINTKNPISPVDTYCFYYFIESTDLFSLLVNLFGDSSKENVLHKIKQYKGISSPKGSPWYFLPFPIFSSSEEKEMFLEEINKNIGNFWETNPSFPCRQLGKNKQSEEKVFSFWSYELFWKWKNTNFLFNRS